MTGLDAVHPRVGDTCVERLSKAVLDGEAVATVHAAASPEDLASR